MASDIKVSLLSATGGLDHIALIAISAPPDDMECLVYMQPVKVEIWAATSNNRANAVKVGESASGLFDHTGLPTPTTRYYWARAVDLSGNVGDFYPVSATGGISATTTLGTAQNAINQMGATVNANITAAVNIEKTERVNSDSALASLIGTVEAKTDAGTATGLFRIVSSAGPSGFTTSLSMEGKVNASGVFRSAGIYIDVSASTSRIRLKAASTVIESSTGAVLALFQNNGTLDYARIPVLQSDKISVQQLSAITSNLGTVNAGTINGLTINGSLFRTAAAGQRIEINSALNRMDVWDNLGRSRVSVGPFGLYSIIAAIYGSGAAIVGGGDGTAGSYGIQGTGGGAGAGVGVVGVPPPSGGYSFLGVSGQVYSPAGFGPFTGMHEALVRKDVELGLGDIAYVVKIIARGELNNVLAEVARTGEVADRRVIGVVSERKPLTATQWLPQIEDKPNESGLVSPVRRYLMDNFDLVTVNALGEGQMDVCGRGGNIGAGDYIVTSDMAGRGQRIDMDQPVTFGLHAAIVAQTMEPVTFDHVNQVKRVAVYYRCG